VIVWSAVAEIAASACSRFDDLSKRKSALQSADWVDSSDPVNAAAVESRETGK
jgi:hypothetical protein